MYLISTDLKVQDQLEGTIRLQRGNICQEQDVGKSRGDSPWVKVLTHMNLSELHDLIQHVGLNSRVEGGVMSNSVASLNNVILLRSLGICLG